jgi:hypothetical protein
MLNAQRLRRTAQYVRSTRDVHYTPDTSVSDTSQACNGQPSNDITRVRAHLIARLDGEARIARTEMLAAQVAAGTYQVDVQALSTALRRSPAISAFLSSAAADLRTLVDSDNADDADVDVDVSAP